MRGIHTPNNLTSFKSKPVALAFRSLPLYNGPVKKDTAAEYLKLLKKRGKESRAYTSYQLLGLELADMLDDNRKKSLYIKLAKIYDPQTLLQIARDIISRANAKKIKNKGAYFMRIFHEDFKNRKQKR